MNFAGRPAKRSSAAWVRDLGSGGSGRARAIGDLHALLRLAALYTLGRTALPGTTMAPADFKKIADTCAREAVLVILDRLPAFRPEHTFTTWAYKHVVRQALAVTREARGEAMRAGIHSAAIRAETGSKAIRAMEGEG